MADEFETMLENDVLTLKNKEQPQYSIKIYAHNILNNWTTNEFKPKNEEGFEKLLFQNFYSPSVYHVIWMYECMKNKVIGDEFIILHRLMRIWR